MRLVCCYQLQLIFLDSIRLQYFVNCFLIVSRWQANWFVKSFVCRRFELIIDRVARSATIPHRQSVPFRFILLMIYSAERFPPKCRCLLFAANEIFLLAPHPLTRLRTMPANINFPSEGVNTHAEAICSDKCSGTPFHHR